MARVLAALVFTCLGLVVGRRRLSVVDRWVSLLLLYFSLPVLTWYVVGYRLSGVARLALGSSLYMLVSLALAPLLVRVAGGGLESRQRAAVVLASVFQNCIFLPLPLFLLVWGDVVPVVAYSVGFNLLLPAAVPLVVSAYTTGLRVSAIVRGYLTFPPFYGLLAGLATFLLGLPQPSYAVHVYRAAAEATLLSFILVGSSIARLWPPRLDRGVAIATAWRLVASPLLHYALALVLGMRGLELVCMMIESVMPPATMNLVFCRVYNLDDGVVASTIITTTPPALGVVALAALV